MFFTKSRSAGYNFLYFLRTGAGSRPTKLWAFVHNNPEIYLDKRQCNRLGTACADARPNHFLNQSGERYDFQVENLTRGPRGRSGISMLVVTQFASPSLAREFAQTSTATSVGDAGSATTVGVMALAQKRRGNVNTCYRNCPPGNSESSWRCKCDCQARDNDGYPCFVHRDHIGRFSCTCM
jgi:hypothetical protein